MDPGAWGYAPAGATSEDAAVVVSARDAKRLKEKLDAAGWLDRTRRPVTHPADDETGRPAAVAFPVLAGSLEGVREMARGDAGALAVCDAALPNLATPVDQRAAARASGGGANDTAGADRGVLPPPPPLDPDAPPLWPPPVPEAPARRDVARVRCPATAEAFAELARAAGGEPLVLTDVPMGNATTAWTPERFATCAEAGHLVDVHVCPPDADESGMRNSTGVAAASVVDLAGHRAPGTRRNFQFRAMPLAEFAARVVASGTKGPIPREETRVGQTHRTFYPPVVAEGETYYLRSVADAKKKRTHVARSFPSLASDLRPGALLPPLSFSSEGSGSAEEGEPRSEIHPTLYPRRAYHSSVLRVASRNVALWTHYDTHDNVLAQIAGRKTVTLWPPDCEPFMHCEGSSSRVADVAAELDTDPNLAERRRRRDAAHPRFARVSGARRVATLEPGEALYIPALWFHHAHATPSEKKEKDDPWNGASVAVNVFWRCLPAADHDPGDVFGNRDPPAARRAAELAARAGAALASLPEPQRRFYARRAVKRLAEQLGYALDLPRGEEADPAPV